LEPKPWREGLFEEISSLASHFNLSRLLEISAVIIQNDSIIPSKIPLSVYLEEISGCLQFLYPEYVKKSQLISLQNSVMNDIWFRVGGQLIAAHKVEKKFLIKNFFELK
jgi:hypothetical protein